MVNANAGFGYRTTAAEVVQGVDLTGQRALVTGGYSGIGESTVMALAGAGAEVTIACRDLPRANAKAAEMNQTLGAARVHAAELDLADLASVRTFAGEFCASNPALHMLINNAAVMACPFGSTANGFETQFGTNHLGHFELFRSLREPLLNAKGARVVCLSSTGHFRSPVHFDDVGFKNRSYDPWAGYGQSKTANALMAVGIQARYAEKGIEAFAVHPGGIMTSLQRHMSKEDIESRGWVDAEGRVNEMFKTVDQGASTSVWAATSIDLQGQGGRYLEDCSLATVLQEPSKDFKGVMNYAVDTDNADKLWRLSEELVG